MKRILSIMMLAALLAATTKAGPLAMNGSPISPLSSIESIGSLEIQLKIRIVSDSTHGTRVVVIGGDSANTTASASVSARQNDAVPRGYENHSPMDGVRDGLTIARALRCAANALLDFLMSHTTGS